MDGRQHREDGARSRRAILEAAAMLASVRGLEGLSIADVARRVDMSKGGVSAHFPTKQDLQLATIGVASEIFAHEVVIPASQRPPGVAQLVGLCEYDLSYVERRVFPGGCFFSAVAAEFCGREGVVKDCISEANAGWLGHLEAVIGTAMELAELDAATDATTLAFELNALMVSANFQFNLNDDNSVLQRAMGTMLRAIDRARPAG